MRWEKIKQLIPIYIYILCVRDCNSGFKDPLIFLKPIMAVQNGTDQKAKVNKFWHTRHRFIRSWSSIWGYNKLFLLYLHELLLRLFQEIVWLMKKLLCLLDFRPQTCNLLVPELSTNFLYVFVQPVKSNTRTTHVCHDAGCLNEVINRD